MNEREFRTTALERLSSPERIDDLLVMTDAKAWIALLASFLLLGTAGIWAFTGSLPTKIAGQGVIVRSGGVLSIATLQGGVILSVFVKVGDRVQANQIVARVAQPALIEKIRTRRLEIERASQDRETAVSLARSDASLQIEANRLEKANAHREIEEIEAQAQLAAEQVPVEDELLGKGLVTKQQTIAARQKVVTLHQQIAARRAAIKNYEERAYAVEAQPKQVASEWAAKIRNLEMLLTDLEKDLSISENVVSPYSGEVIEVQVVAGSVVQAEGPILSVQSNTQILEALVCVPARFAKSVAKGMDAEISPSPIKREEYGFIRGKVVYVAGYPATAASLLRTFQNQTLIHSVTSAEPVTEIRIQMLRDRSASTGFQWSSSKGPEMPISSGNLCTVEVITRKQRPIDLLLPNIKKTIGLT